MPASSAAFASSSPPLALSSRSSCSALFFLRSWKKNRSTWYSSFLLFATQELKAFLSVFFSLLVFSRRHFLTSSMVILFFVSSLALFRVAIRLPRDPSNASLMISSFGLAFHVALRFASIFFCIQSVTISFVTVFATSSARCRPRSSLRLIPMFFLTISSILSCLESRSTLCVSSPACIMYLSRNLSSFSLICFLSFSAFACATAWFLSASSFRSFTNLSLCLLSHHFTCTIVTVLATSSE